MLKRFFATAFAAVLLTFGLASPAHATGYDYAVTASATVNSVNVPSVVTWTINVASVGDAMGEFDEQDGHVEFDVPSNFVSLVVTNDCAVVNSYHVTCHWYASNTGSSTYHVSGLIGLLAVGTMTVTPTITDTEPYTDSNSANDSTTVSCTVITSLIITC